MTVYIEYIILDNFFITFLICILSYRFCGKKVSVIKSIIASGVGTVVAVFYPFINIHNALLVLIKLALGVVLGGILFFKKSVTFGAFIKGLTAFLLTTFLFGGILTAVGLMVHGSIEKALKLPAFNFPIGAVVGAAVIIYLIIKKVTIKHKKIKDAKSFTIDTEIDIFDKTFKGIGFIDTGNRLYDEKSGLPLAVLNIKTALSVLGDDNLGKVITKRGAEIQNGAHYIDFSTLSGKKSQILVLKPDRIRLYFGQTQHTIIDVAVGIAFSAFSDVLDYDVILPPSIIDCL